MIPDKHIVDSAIEFVVGSIGLRAAAPVFRIAGGFVWEAVMDEARSKAFHHTIEFFGHKWEIHHPNRDNTNKHYTLMSHYLHPERFSPLLQRTIAVEMAKVAVVAESEPARSRQIVPVISLERKVAFRTGVEVYT